jgi:hypothetical protein
LHIEQALVVVAWRVKIRQVKRQVSLLHSDALVF